MYAAVKPERGFDHRNDDQQLITNYFKDHY
jgi:hypothetical protein